MVDSRFNKYNIYKILNQNRNDKFIQIKNFSLVDEYAKKDVNKFNVVIFDNPNINFLKTKDILKDSINIFLAEANVLGVEKLNLLINKKTKEINKRDIEIIFNKYNSNSIDIEVLYKVFKEIKIIGKIPYRNEIDILINTGKLITINKIKTDLLKIIKELIKGGLVI